MNIAKLQSQLESVPDQALIGYVQNPDGQVPSYLALAEISRRRQVRAGGSAKPAPTQTVAEQEITTAEPGIVSLPVDNNMYSEQSMAAGGIVSFDGGGYVPLSYADYINLLPTEQQKYVNQYGAAPTRSATPLESMGIVRNPALSNVLRRGAPLSPEIKAPMIAPGTTFAPDKAEGVSSPVVNPRAATTETVSLPPSPTASPTASSARVPTASGIGSIAPASRFTPIESDGAAFDSMMPSQEARTIGAGQEEFRAALGEDPNQARMAEKLAGMESRANQEEERAPWMALAEAGLGMAAGTSPFALQNIAEGGKQGLKSLQAAKERAAAAEEKRFAIESELARAQRAEQVAATNYGADSKRTADATATTVGLAKRAEDARVNEFNAKGAFEDKALTANLNMEQKKINANLASVNRQIQAAESSARKNELMNKRDSIKALLSDETKNINNLRTEIAKTALVAPDVATELKSQLKTAMINKSNYATALAELASDDGSRGTMPSDIGDLVNQYTSK